jgi:molecular chaperone DnaK
LSDPIVGIDLGTSNSVVAYADATGQVKVLADDGGYKIHPSVVSFHPNGGVVVGAAAKQRKVIDPQNTIYSVKRLIGRSYRSPEVQTAKTRSPFQIKEGANQGPMIVTRGGEFAVPEVSAIVLDHMRNIAAARLGTPVNRAVVTVPASFNDAQRSATATAGAIAGLTVVRVLNEPTAAALAYGHTRNLRETIAVYDFGGGTFDITILRLNDQVYEVLGTSGDTFLGGDDLDERLVDKMVAKFLAENRIDLRTNEVSMMRLRAVAEQTKIELSRRSRAVVRIDEIAYGAKGVPLDLQIEITRDEFVSHVADIIDRTFPVCQEALSIAGIGIDSIADIILVGGTTKIPYVRDQVSKFFAKAPRADVNPEDAVAIGAALQATSLERILARPRAISRSVPIVKIDPADLEDSSTSSFTDVDATIPSEPSPLGRLQPPEKPDTSYSVTRTGNRDRFEDRKSSAGMPPLVDERPPVPLGRLAPGPPSPPPIPKSTTARGPAARAQSSVLQTQAIPLTLRPPASPSPSSTQPGMGTESTTQPRMNQGDWTGELTTNPASTQPLHPPQRPVAPPNAPTMIVAPDLDVAAASTAKGLIPATTARGFQAPQSYPVTSVGELAALAPERAPPVLLEVTPRSLGIGTVAGFCEELIRRNSRVPTEIKKLFTTSRDRQDLVRIVVCQGESRRLDNNTVIGDLVLQNLPPRPRGETSIEVTFMLDASGILQVSARDAETGTEQRASLDLVGDVAQQDVATSRERIQQLRR